MLDEIPDAPSSGADGSQVAGKADTELVVPRAMPTNVGGVIQTYAQPEHFQEFGRSPLISDFLYASWMTLSQDLADAKGKISALEGSLEIKRTEHSEARTKIAVLEEKLSSVNEFDWAFQLLNVFGAVLLGLSVDLFKGSSNLAATICCVLGAALLIIPSVRVAVRHGRDLS